MHTKRHPPSKPVQDLDACTGASLGMADLESSAADEPTEGRGAARQSPAGANSAGLPSGYLLLITHHGALP